MGIYVKRKGRRGSALFVVAYLGLFLAGIVGTYFYSTSQKAATNSKTRENAAGAQSVAEMANEVAIAQLQNMKYKTDSTTGKKLSVSEDWVGLHPYGSTGLDRAERRLSGTIGAFDYRTVVRSVRVAKEVQENNEAGAPPSGWLANVELKDYEFGVDPVWGYTGVYEIISSAHNENERGNPDLTYDAAVRTLVSLDYNSINKDQDELAVLHMDHPQLLAASAESLNDAGAGYNPKASPWFDYDVVTKTTGTVKVGGVETIQVSTIGSVGTIQVSGEDHYSVKASVKEPTSDAIIENWETIGASDSELFSVTNDYWDKGKMTLHYKLTDGEYNPQIPRTINFDDWPVTNNSPFSGNARTTGTINRQMIARFEIADKSLPDADKRTVDQYVYGGKSVQTEYSKLNPATNSSLMYKRGRSITLDESNTIIQTTQAQVHPDYMAAASANNESMTTTTIAVGKTEKIFNLYYNLVETSTTHSHPAATASEAAVQSWITSRWTQQSLGYFSKNKINLTGSQVTKARRPLNNYNSPTKRRWATLIWVKDEIGRFLVREYDGTYDSPTSAQSDPNGNWLGTYRWAYYGGYNSTYKYHYGAWVDPELYAISTSRNYQKVLNTRFLTMEELLGEQVEKASDGLPAAFSSGTTIMGGVPKFRLDGEGKRIPYRPVAGDDVNIFDESYQRSNADGDNYNVGSTSQMPPLDGIYVLLEDTTTTPDFTRGGKRYKRYQNLKEFSYKRDVAKRSASQSTTDVPPIWRNVTTLHMVFEIDPEATSQDYMYFDMGLTVAVVYPLVEGGDENEDKSAVVDTSRQWWEGEAQEGLTGKLSHAAVSAHMDELDPKLAAAESESDAARKEAARMKAYFEQFGFSVPAGHPADKVVEAAESMSTMLDQLAEKIGFGVAKLDDNGVLRVNEDVCGNYLPDWIFYIGQEELWQFIDTDKANNPSLYSLDAFIAAHTEDEMEAFRADQDLLNAKLEEWREEIGLARIDSINDAKYGNCTFIKIDLRYDDPNHVKADLAPETMTTTFKFPERNITSRYFAAQAFGYKNVRTPSAFVKLDSSNVITPLKENDIDPTASSDNMQPVKKSLPFLPGEIAPALDKPSLEADSAESYIPLLFKEGFLQPNQRPLESKFVWLSGADPDESEIATIHVTPKWFKGGEPIPNVDLWDILEGRAINEHRGAIGWHREGPKPLTTSEAASPGTAGDALESYLYGDSYEFVVMAEKGFNPYYTVNMSYRADDGSTANGEFVALFPPEEGSTDTALFKPRLKSPGQMPTFVLDKDPNSNRNQYTGGELDGAGIMVVAGNLEIKTKFAYHGLLVVLGDVKVEAFDRVLPDKEGKFYNSNGDELLKDGSGNWYYLMGNGTPKYGDTPVPTWLGDLVVQGKVLVGGNLYTVDGDRNTGKPAGNVDIRGSEGAIKDTVELWSDAAPNEGFNSIRMGWSSGSGSSDFNLWKD